MAITIRRAKAAIQFLNDHVDKLLADSNINLNNREFNLLQKNLDEIRIIEEASQLLFTTYLEGLITDNNINEVNNGN